MPLHLHLCLKFYEPNVVQVLYMQFYEKERKLLAHLEKNKNSNTKEKIDKEQLLTT